jgi:hypothetical protein
LETGETVPIYFELRAEEQHRALILRADEAGKAILRFPVGDMLDVVKLAIEGTEFELLDPLRDLNVPNAARLPIIAAGVVRAENGKLTAITGYGGMVFYDDNYRDMILGPSIIRLREQGSVLFKGAYLSEVRAARGEPR